MILLRYKYRFHSQGDDLDCIMERSEQK